MTTDPVAAAREELEGLRREVREDLAEVLGGDPEDYHADRAAADGGPNRE